MKTNVLKSSEIEIQYLEVCIRGILFPEDIEIGDKYYDEWDEIKEKYPTLFTSTKNSNNNTEFVLRINVNNGKVENWPENITGNFRTVKVVDSGIYILRDADKNEIYTHKYCYVPSCLQIDRNGWGDYFEFTINKDGFIRNWKFSQKDVNEIMSIENEENDD